MLVGIFTSLTLVGEVTYLLLKTRIGHLTVDVDSVEFVEE